MPSDLRLDLILTHSTLLILNTACRGIWLLVIGNCSSSFAALCIVVT